jgi:hypothetical protein
MSALVQQEQAIDYTLSLSTVRPPNLRARPAPLASQRAWDAPAVALPGDGHCVSAEVPGLVEGRVGSSHECALYVHDDGVQCDMAYVDKLFGASEFEDLGIGLATARRILRRHGLRVWGEVEKGATFYLRLPTSA